jgi:hypothetical protein
MLQLCRHQLIEIVVEDVCRHWYAVLLVNTKSIWGGLNTNLAYAFAICICYLNCEYFFYQFFIGGCILSKPLYGQLCYFVLDKI